MNQPLPVEAVTEAPQVGAAGDEFWHSLIDEKAAGEFLDLTDRFLQEKRSKGGGPRYIHLSSRCIRYRRIDLKQWADEHVRTSTSDPGSEGAS